MTMVLPGIELFLPDAAAWRAWLAENHDSVPAVWLVLTKKGGTTTALDYAGALDEALCFGWIDGQTRRRDDETTFQRWTPRGPRSRWSLINIGHVERLTAAGRMTPAGLAAVEAAKADGRWEAAYAGPATAETPPDLLAALAANPDAQAMFDVLTSQNRYALYHRLTAIKTEAARARRVADYVAMLARGETIHPQKRRPVTE
ncbi:YdeI/OmpD-associated family protein [Nocardioides sp. CER19]|uniref:YdeI/OmpD-associated family protein n=1 Tax=Nocardioides sp. CER19 TaxID=3038538 RepID=UPI0024471EA0|nr:YdeI/OmpD-associated family protein [Nocardioides sp. CER19]MDH2412618.1 YdeI/OmpD-associated family protein [Nocardioides sp. CER19]